jgi:flagellar motor switch protein FliM
MDVKVGLTTHFMDITVSLDELMNFKDGDIIPVNLPDVVTVSIEDLPTFRAKIGKSRDMVALQITDKIPRPNSVKSELQLFTKGGKVIDSDSELSILEEDLLQVLDRR